MDVIQNILKLLELAARGRSSTADEANLSTYAKELFAWSSEVAFVCEGDSSMVNTAVMLHNKVRNVAVSDAKRDIKPLIRASVAFIIHAYGQMIPKVLSTCIKLHCKAANELQQVPDQQEAIYKSRCDAIQAWEDMDESVLEQSIPIPDLEELHHSIFFVYMEKCKQMSESVATGVAILIKDTLVDESKLCDIIRTDLAKAFAITQTKGSCNNLLREYIEISVKLCCRMVVNHNALESLIPLLNSILVLCDMPPKSNSKLPPFVDSINSAKYNIQVSLSYIYQELDQYDDSLNCIRNIENQNVKMLTDAQQQAITYNKFHTCCKSKNEIEARKSLAAGFEYKFNPHSIMLNMVLMFISISLDSNYTDCNNIFKQLCEQYTENAELCSSLIAHLRYILTYAVFPSIDGTSTYDTPNALMDAEAILKNLISVNNQEQYSMETEQLEELVSMICTAISSFRTLAKHSSVVTWTTLALSLFEDTNNDSRMIWLVQRAEAHIYMKEFHEAFTDASAALKVRIEERSILMLFLSTLFAHDSATAIERMHTLLSEATVNNTITENKSLEVIFLCKDYLLGMVKKIEQFSAMQFENTIVNIYLEWLTFYELHSVWSIDRDVPTSPSSYFSTVALLFQHLLECNNYFEKQQDSTATTNTTNKRPHSELTNDESAGKKQRFSSDESSSDCFGVCSYEKHTKCSSFEFKHYPLVAKTLSRLVVIIREIRGSISDVDCVNMLGGCTNLQWIISCCWNIATNLLCTILQSSGMTEFSSDCGKLMQMAALIYDNIEILMQVKNSVVILSDNNAKLNFNCDVEAQVECALYSCMLQMDEMESNKTLMDNDYVTSMLLIRNKLISVSELLEDCDSISIKTKRLHLTLALIAQCRSRGLPQGSSLSKCEISISGDSNNGDTQATSISSNILPLIEYIHENQQLLLCVMSPKTLLDCATMTQKEKYGNIEAARMLLSLAIQAGEKTLKEDISASCTDMEVNTNHTMQEDTNKLELREINIGWICRAYSDMVMLCSSRFQALSYLKSFEEFCIQNQLHTTSYPKPPLYLEYVENITSLSYNYGVSLLELEQYDLAEQYLSYCMKLAQYIPHMSPHSIANEWNSYIQETYETILHAKHSSKLSKNTVMLTNLETSLSHHLDTQAPSPENAKQKDTLLSMTGLLH